MVTVESVCCGATHACTRTNLLELIGCGAVGVGLALVVEALMGRGSEVEGQHGGWARE